MSLTAETVKKLAAPLDAARVKHREGSGGKSLSYLEGHDVVRTANEVFGVGNWTYFVTELTCLGEEPVVSKYNKPGFRVAYRAVVTVGSGGSGYSDVGYGDAQEYTGSKLTPHELASKEAVTDGLKRALKNFGDQFGLCLYDKDAPEHSGRPSGAPGTGANGSTAPVGTGGGGGAAASTGFPPESVAAPTSPFEAPASARGGDLCWKYGEHQGLSIAATPLDFVIRYAEEKPDTFMGKKCKEFLAENDFAASGVPDSDIPFDRTIDGLGG